MIFYLIGYIFYWFGFVIDTPIGYNSGLKERYRYIMHCKEEKANKQRKEKVKTEAQIYRELKKNKDNRKAFLEFYQ